MGVKAGISILVLGGFLTGLSGAVTSAVAELTFERHEVVLASAQRPTVLTGFLLGGPAAETAEIAQLAVVSIDDNDDRRLRIYGLGDGTDRAWTPKLDATLRPGVLFVDMANIGGRDRLVTYERGRLSWFDPESATERMLVAVACNFDPSPRGRILHVDITKDVNGDDRDDLVVPDLGGFRVLIQMDGGAFADPVRIGPSTETRRIYGADGYRYDPWVQGGRVHEMDHDGDGRSDLVFWNGDRFEVHHQDERGLFAPAAEIFTTDVAFDSDALYALGTGAKKVLRSLSDLNGDGVADLMAYSLEGASFRTTWSRVRSLSKMNSTYEVHLGAIAADGGTAFASDADTAIHSGGVQLGMRQHDFDRDGQVDLMFTTVDYGILKIIGALVTGSKPLNLEFYRMEGGLYPASPNAVREIRGDFPPDTEGAFYPAVLIGDVNGDGRSDLLMGKNRDELRVFLGVPGPDLFARRPQKVQVAMPSDEEYTWLVDLDQDGKQDVLVHHPSTTEPHRLTLLIAR